MFGYYLDLARRSLRRNWIMTALMVLAIGLGIGASMTMITVIHVMSGDPLPGLSAKLYMPMLDPRPVPEPGDRQYGINGTPDGFSWVDAMNLLRAHKADKQAIMVAGTQIVHPKRAGLHPFGADGQYVTAEFFTMFDVPFRAGHGWTATQDKDRARVVVLSEKLAHKLFGDASAVGKTVRLDGSEFRVVGVTAPWHPQPKFYAQHGHGLFGRVDEFFLPLQTATHNHVSINGHISCWGSGDDLKSGHCTWLQFWVKLDSPAKAAAYRRYLTGYWHEQQSHGRFPRKQAPPHLYGLMAWLAHEHIIPSNLSMQMWLAVGFLVVAMLCVMALLLAKFLRRSGEVSVRRAMGACRRSIFAQLGIEAGLIGVAGGLLGVGIAELGLWTIRQQPEGYAHMASMDVRMLLATIVLAIVASIVAGLLPAWRACQVPPALQLKSQ